MAARTNGLLSKAALANYETGHRGIRVEVLWVIARALGEDVKTLLDRAELQVRRTPSGSGHGPLTVKVNDVMAATDPRLGPVKRWVELRATGPNTEMLIDDAVLAALATLMELSVADCRLVLLSVTGQEQQAPAGP